MTEHGTLARPYAQAIFEVARESGDFGAWSGFLEMAAAAVCDPAVSRMLLAPGTNLDALALAIADISRTQLGDRGPLHCGERSQAASLLRLLAHNQRLSALPDIAARYEVLRAEAENVLEVVLTSATPVSQPQQERIAAALKKRFGREIRLTVTIDPALIGGARLKVGDRVIDGSVRNGLDKLATALQA